MKFLNYVNVKMGTASTNERSFGNTNPLTARPFGMNHFFLQTRNVNGNWLYHPSDVRTTGFRLTHIPSPWIGDYARLVMMPTCGNDAGASTNTKLISSFDVNNAVMTPSFIKAYLIRYGITAELVPTMRGGIMRISYSDDALRYVNGAEEHRFAIDYSGKDVKNQDSVQKGHFIKVNYNSGTVTGYTNFNKRDENLPKNFKMYFILKFNAKISKTKTIYSDGTVNLAFEDSPKTVKCRFATSFISIDQAKYNLKKEVGRRSLEALKREGEK